MLEPCNRFEASTLTARRIEFEALDGVTLVGSWFLNTSCPTPSIVVVIAPGGGIRAASYRRLAQYLCHRGAAVLCFDYRGIGESRRANLRALEAGIIIWGRDDLGAALALAASRFPQARLGLVAHSIASAMIGAAPTAGSIHRVVFFAPHTAYWGEYHPLWRLPMFLAWHVLMPLITPIVGYFPGRALCLGEDLPKSFALEWAGRLHRDIRAFQAARRRWDATLEQYTKVTADALAISVTDDAFAPPVAAAGALALYPRMNVMRRIISPASLGLRHLGHMAFLRRRTGPLFWREAAAWLLQCDRSIDYPSTSTTA